MTELLGKLLFWHWWILGVVLVGVELLVPAEYFLWMGISAGLVGGALLLFPELAWEFQFILFGVFSLVSIVGLRVYQHRNPVESEEPMLNRRGSQYIGRTFVLQEDMPLGRGELNVDDTRWRAVCDSEEDLPAGSRIKVIGIEGTTLKVEPA